MAFKKKTFKPDYFASRCGAKETYGTIYYSLLTDEKFLKLSNMARYLYVCCRVQSTSRLGRECLYNHGNEEGVVYGEGCFVLPAKHQREYGLNDRGNVAKWMKELIDAGFVDKLETNKHRKKVNVYRFSTRWRDG